jgi:hypothetical protein
MNIAMPRAFCAVGFATRNALRRLTRARLRVTPSTACVGVRQVSTGTASANRNAARDSRLDSGQPAEEIVAKQAKRTGRKAAAEAPATGKKKAGKRAAAVGLPKTFAGMKVPKALRNSSMISALINNPVGREVLADALLAGATAAAAALRANAAATRRVGRARKAVAAASSDAAESAAKTKDLVEHAVGTASGALTEAVGKAAKKMLPEFLGGEAKPGRRRRAAARTAEQPRATRTARTPRKPRVAAVAVTTTARRPRRKTVDAPAASTPADTSKTSDTSSTES